MREVASEARVIRTGNQYGVEIKSCDKCNSERIKVKSASFVGPDPFQMKLGEPFEYGSFAWYRCEECEYEFSIRVISEAICDERRARLGGNMIGMVKESSEKRGSEDHSG